MATNKYRVKVQSELDNLESYRKRIFFLILKINEICSMPSGEKNSTKLLED